MIRYAAYWLFILGVIGGLPVFGDVVINEIMYRSQTNDLDLEYVELYNTLDQPVDLSGWRFKDGIDFTFPEGTAIDGNGYLLVCRNEVFLRTFYNLSASIHSVGNFSPSKLSNAGEEIGLYDQDENRVDRVEYSDSDPWPVQADGKGSSLELVFPTVDNNNVVYWKASVRPTPGLPNSTLVQAVPPRLQQIQRLPQSPTPANAVRIVAVFASGDQLKSVSLNYWVNGGAAKTVAMTAQNGAYVAEIPEQAKGSAVEYTVAAINQDGFQLTAPTSQALSRYLYVVTDNPPAVGSIIINEIMYNNPSTDGEDHEWIELYNPSSQSIDLSWWGVRDSNDQHIFRIPKGTSIAANGFLLIAKEKDAGWQAPTLSDFPYSLNDKGDAVRLYDPNDQLIASVEFNDKGEWPKGADGDGGSLELLQTSRSNGEANNWAVSAFGGTPGKANARAISDPTYCDYEIIINELFYHPEDEGLDSNLDKEYIELFNRSDKTVDLSGWYFSNGIEFSFPQGTSIPAGGYLLVCRNVDQYPNVSNKVGNYILQLNNAGETLALTSDLGVVVDCVRYNDKYPWPARPDGDGNSLELIVPSGDNTLHYNWRSGQPNSPGLPNSVILPNEPPHISDIAHTPECPAASVSEQKTEEKAIIKVGDSWRYLKGKQASPTNWNVLDFDDSSWAEGPSGLGYADNDDATQINDMQNSYLGLYVRKSFTLDTVEGFQQVVLTVDYDDGFVAYLNGVEVARSNVTGAVPTFDVPATASHEAGSPETFDITSSSKNLRVGKNVLAILGLNNGLTSTDFSLIPSLSTVRVITGGEDAADSVLVTAQVEDSNGLAEVNLNYQRCSSPYGTGLVLDTWKTVPMFDDGTGGDAIAGDGIYSYKLNYAETLRPGEVWRYTISATNKTGQKTTMPLPGEKTETRAFYVDDRLNSTTNGTMNLFMERTVLDWLNRNPDSNQEQPCILVVFRKVYDLLNSGGVRYKGGDEANKPQKSWKIQFAKDNRWKGLRTYTLNANYQTSPLLRGEAGFLENLANLVMSETELPVRWVWPTRLALNGSYYGLFLGVNPYDEVFLEDWNLPAETRIFRAGSGSRVANLSTEINREAYAQKYENVIGQKEDLDDLIAFIEGLNTSSDVKAFFEVNLDIEKYLNYLAGAAVLSYEDNNEQNYYPVHATDGRWFVLPGEMVHTWGEMETNSQFPLVSTTSVLDGAEGGLWGVNQLKRKFLSVPEYRQRYFDRVRDLIDHIFTREHLDIRIDTYWNFRVDVIQENVQRWNMPGQIDSMVAEMKKYVTARREFILKEINAGLQIPTAPVNGSPAEGAILSSRTVELMAEVPISRAPIMMEWEIQKDAAIFAYPLWSKQGNENMPTTQVPATVLASDATYYWRVRYQVNDIWSDWSKPTSFKTSANLDVPDVQDVVVTSLDKSVRLEWTLPIASDLVRVDIYQDNSIVESAPIADNRIRITGLENGLTYTFVIKVVAADLRMSKGVTVTVKPLGPVAEGNTIAYFRFEDDAKDSIGLFPDGTLLGSAVISAPPAANPVPLTQQTNTASLQLGGAAGNGFQFGSGESFLNVEQRMTLECYALFSLNAIAPGVLLDRYDESNAASDGVWRFGVGLSNHGSIDFFFNDGDTNSGYSGRFHAATAGGIAPYDGLFHHYAAAIDLSAVSAIDKVKLYLDGYPVQMTILNEDGVSSYKHLRTDSNLPVLVGARRSQSGTADAIPGRIDEVRLTAGVLAPKQFLIGPNVTAVQEWSLY